MSVWSPSLKRPRFILPALALAAMLGMATQAGAQEALQPGFFDLGKADGEYAVYVGDISANGGRVAYWLGGGYSTPYVWNRNGGSENIGKHDQEWVETRRLSADGKVVVGQYDNIGMFSGGWKIYRLDASGQFQKLGDMGGHNAWVQSVSADASVIAGDYSGDDGRFFVWKNGDYQRISTNSRHASIAMQLSADGSTALGSSKDRNSGKTIAFRWTQADGVQYLDELFGKPGVTAQFISDNGSVIGGFYRPAGVPIWFRWSREDGLQELNTLTGVAVASLDGMSADGQTLAGSYQDAGKTTHLFRWSAATGLQDLVTPAGSNFKVDGLSADGSQIVAHFTDADRAVHFLRGQAGRALVDLGSLGKAQISAVSVSKISASGNAVIGTYTTLPGVPKHAFVYELEDAEAAAATRLKAEEQARAAREQAATDARKAQQSALAQDEEIIRRLQATGKPAQLYAQGIDFEAQGHTESALRLYRHLVDAHPDSPYTAKAVDKLESLRKAPAAAPAGTQADMMRAQTDAQRLEFDKQRYAEQKAQQEAVTEAQRQQRKAAYNSCLARFEACATHCEAHAAASIITSVAGAANARGTNWGAVQQVNNQAQSACNSCNTIKSECDAIKP